MRPAGAAPARRVVLVFLGAAAVALERLEETVDRLAARGEAVERREKARIGRRFDRAARAAWRIRENVLETIGGAAESVWRQLGVPTHSDLAAVERRLDALRGVVERLDRPRGKGR